MLRIIGLSVILIVGAAIPAAAGGDRIHLGVAGAAQPGGALDRGSQPSAWTQATPGQRMAVLGAAPPPLRPGGLGVQRQVVGATHRLNILALDRRQPQGLVLPWRSQGRSTVALSLTDRLAVGLGYRHIRGEDLWREFADIRSADHESHRVLLRAHWRF
jgi:hypothetical protein